MFLKSSVPNAIRLVTADCTKFSFTVKGKGSEENARGAGQTRRKQEERKHKGGKRKEETEGRKKRRGTRKEQTAERKRREEEERAASEVNDVEVEYIQEELELDPLDPMYRHFSKIFATFKKRQKKNK